MFNQYDPQEQMDRDPHDECRFEIQRLSKLVDSHAAEVNRRRGEMAVAREALTECGVPAIEDGTTLTMSQRINRLAESRGALRQLCRDIRDEFEDRYDGAEDSNTRWMGRFLNSLENAIRE